MITKYGYGTLAVVFIISLVLIAVAIYVPLYIAAVLIALALLSVVFTLQFFRDPNRTPPETANVVVSPADGKVVVIKDLASHPFYGGGAAKQVSVFMSPLNVHVNRIPISGKVIHFKYIEGEYLVAFDDACGERNERTEIGIDNGKIKLFFKQISGYVARRIVSEVKTGDEVRIGERFGMIRFGSRVDMFLPPEVQIKVKLDEIARAGETVIASY
ncbi:MAG: phosphatidylserine decarboxylase [Rhizobacter sp.]|nr:phosphatidylserine decarboxylase [Chlorobiales bacterium]